MVLVGEHLSRPTYTCLQTIGEGRSGVCRRGRHEIFGTEIVQKTISLLGVPDGIAHEPRLLESADHPHIIKVREAQWDPDPTLVGVKAVTFVCPYYEGGSVLNALQDGHVFSIAQVIEAARNLLDALAYLHQKKGYLHRDIKPGNILLDPGYTGGCLADLGSAAQIGSDGCTDNNGGTPLYLDPAAQVTGYMTVRSDLFSLGATLAEMLRGRYLYEEIERDSISERHSQGKRALPDSAYDLPPEIPDPLRRFLRSLCHPSPGKRPDSAETALRKLNQLQVLPWERLSNNGLIGCWIGTWPTSGPLAKRKEYRVDTETEVRGKQSGRVKVTVRQRKPGGEWRAIRNRCDHVDAGDAKALARVFRMVERSAQR